MSTFELVGEIVCKRDPVGYAIQRYERAKRDPMCVMRLEGACGEVVAQYDLTKAQQTIAWHRIYLHWYGTCGRFDPYNVAHHVCSTLNTRLQ